MRLGLCLATMLTASSLAAAEAPLTIDQLLAQGWEIAGYASGYDNRTSLLLFRHAGMQDPRATCYNWECKSRVRGWGWRACDELIYSRAAAPRGCCTRRRSQPLSGTAVLGSRTAL